jgi:hypothetical protein
MEYLCWQLLAIKHISAGCELSLKKNKKSSYILALTREGSSEWKIAPRGGQLPQSLARLSIQAEKSLAEAIIAVEHGNSAQSHNDISFLTLFFFFFFFFLLLLSIYNSTS